MAAEAKKLRIEDASLPVTGGISGASAAFQDGTNTPTTPSAATSSIAVQQRLAGSVDSIKSMLNIISVDINFRIVTLCAANNDIKTCSKVQFALAECDALYKVERIVNNGHLAYEIMRLPVLNTAVLLSFSLSHTEVCKWVDDADINTRYEYKAWVSSLLSKVKTDGEPVRAAVTVNLVNHVGASYPQYLTHDRRAWKVSSTVGQAWFSRTSYENTRIAARKYCERETATADDNHNGTEFHQQLAIRSRALGMQMGHAM